MKIIEANFALKFLYVYISAIVCIKVQCEHVSFISGEENAEDILDTEKDLTGVNYRKERVIYNVLFVTYEFHCYLYQIA